MNKVMLTRSFILLFISVLGLAFLAIGSCETSEKQELLKDHEVVGMWAELALHIAQYTPANSPTYASRCFGYIGLTMYESIVAGYDDYNSLEGQLNGLNALPKIEQAHSYNWPLSLNAGQASIIRNIYNQTSEANKAKIDSLEAVIYNNISSHLQDKEAQKRSKEYGKSIAEHIFQWSQSDGGHRAYLNNFDKEWKHPEFKGSWKPPLFAQSFSHHPLHPHWGSNRTFVTQNSDLPIPEMIPYSTDKSSPYYQQFMEVYQADLALTQEQKEIALWWGDDPDDTFTPPGHSYYIASLVIHKKQPSLVVGAATLANVGMAVADAFINCWKWKYHHFTERANTFVPQQIDQEWESFWPDPPFPSFPSGHAIQAAAAATVLIDLYGPEFSFVDSSHVNRERDKVRDVDFIPRSFSGFWEVAEETAQSRFYGGIHIPHDNKVGLEEGARIAQNVNKLNWKTETK